MKASAALLAGLLAGLALGSLDRAQPHPTLVPRAHAQDDVQIEYGVPSDDDEPEEKNPLKGANRKTIKCVVGCQEPYQKCQSGCGKNEVCVDKCGKNLMSCTEGCGVDMQKLVPDEKKKGSSEQKKGKR